MEDHDSQSAAKDPNAGLAQDGPGDVAPSPLDKKLDTAAAVAASEPAPEEEAEAERSMRNIEVIPPPVAELPTLGRVVRYVLPNGSLNVYRDRAAIVADVEEGQDITTLSVFKAEPNDLIDSLAHTDSPVSGCVAGWDVRSAVGLVHGVPFDPAQRPGTWHWPKRK